MREEDLPEVVSIEKMCFPNPWGKDTFRGEIQNRAISFPLVAVHREDRRIVGYIIFWLIGDEAQINNVAVHPDYQGKGYGERLMRYALEQLREYRAHFVTLEVRVSNTRAFNLYKKLGFSVLGVRKEYYSNPTEDAYVMGLILD
jgi:ribosomal-protein-alanine N-acetyltransferase